MRLADKTCIITGAASGQGRAAAFRFAAEGARVVVTDIDSAVEEVAGDIDRGGGTAAAVVMDVTDPAGWDRAVEEALRLGGQVDVLYNNAAVILADDRSVVDTDPAVWRRVLEVNLIGPMLGCQRVLPLMVEQGSGSIINTSSIRARLGASTPQDAYAASKGALLSLTRSLAVQFGPSGIRSNAIAPGTIETPMIDLHGREGLERRLERYPLGRFGTPDEIAHLAVYLASDESGWTNGAVLVVDGGATVTYV